MSECNIDRALAREAYPKTCARCGLGPCEVWRDQVPPIGADPKPEVPNPPSGGATEIRPDPAYAAALSEQAILVEARAKALGLAIKLLGPMALASETDIAPDTLKGVANDFLRYLLEGK